MDPGAKFYDGHFDTKLDYGQLQDILTWERQ